MPKGNYKYISDKKIRTLTLITTRECNLRCNYCYEKKLESGNNKMDIEVAKKAISKYLSAKDGFHVILIDFFGGEPLLEFNLICEIFEWTIAREWPKKYHFNIGTNATLLTNDIKNWMIENKDRLTATFSINGNRKAHNLTRDNSYDLLSEHIPFFIDTWPKQPAKMTICEENIPYVAESIIEFEEMGLNFSANIAFENFWGPPEKEKMMLDIYNEQLKRLVEYYTERIDLTPPPRILDAVPIYLGLGNKYSKNGECTRFCGAGHEMILVDIDGETYPCHRFLPWVTGREAPKNTVNTQTEWNNEVCSDCKIVDMCPTCAGYNWELYGDTSMRSNFHCKATKLEVLASAKLFAQRLKKSNVLDSNNLGPVDKSRIKNHVEILLELYEEGI